MGEQTTNTQAKYGKGPLTGLTNSVYLCVFSAILPGVKNPPLEQSSLFPTLDDFLATHPAWSSFGTRIMIWFFYLGPVFFIGRLRTLGGLTPEDRERYLLAWEKNPIYAVRQGLLLLKMLAAMGYGGDPRFQRSIGYAKTPRFQKIDGKAGLCPPSVSGTGVPASGGSVNLIGNLRPEEVGFDDRLFRRGGQEECDYCVIGSGAGGAPVAALLAREGYKVVILEEGPAVKYGQFTPDYWGTTKLLFRDLTMNMASGQAFMPILQGCCVGGTTTVNSAICWRLPEEVWASWKKGFGSGSPLTDERLDDAFRRLNKELHIRPTQPEVLGRNSLLMERACRNLGIPGHPIDRNEQGCEGSGLCFSGCPNGHKLSMENSYIPDAITHGARLYPLCRAESLAVEKGRAAGVAGRLLEPRGKRPGAVLTVKVRRGVILAAGVVHSPLFLLKHGISSRHAGRHFMCHPGVSVAAEFPDDVYMWDGAGQGYETVHFRLQGFKIESLSLHPEILMLRLPGIGKRWVERIPDMPRMALWAVAIKAESKGRVGPGWLGPRISFRFSPKDARTMLDGVKTLGKMFFAAGAQVVYPGIFGMPEEIRNPQELETIDTVPPDPRTFVSLATHLFSTCRMGADPGSSVVGPNFECHEMPGLFITDGSVLPTNTGVNPQLTIMAFSVMAAGLLS